MHSVMPNDALFAVVMLTESVFAARRRTPMHAVSCSNRHLTNPKIGCRETANLSLFLLLLVDPGDRVLDLLFVRRNRVRGKIP